MLPRVFVPHVVDRQAAGFADGHAGGGEHDHPGDGILLRGVAADDAGDEHVGDHAEDFGDDVAGDQHGGAGPAGEVGDP